MVARILARSRTATLVSVVGTAHGGKRRTREPLVLWPFLEQKTKLNRIKSLACRFISGDTG